MKQKLISCLFLLSAISGWGQGTVIFANASTILPSPPDRQVTFNSSWLTGNPWLNGIPVSSNIAPGLRAQLYYGASTVNDIASLVAVTTAPATFRPSTSANVGSWIGGTVTLGFFTAGSTVNLQVRVWDISLASTWDQAFATLGTSYFGAIGLSGIFQYTIPLSPLATPSDYTMQNFTGFSVTVPYLPPTPEPGVGALALLTAGLLLMMRKPKRFFER